MTWPLSFSANGALKCVPAPSFDFDFLSGSLDSSITFSRSGNTATRVNSSGVLETVNADIPRFDYDPLNLQSLGLIIETASKNYITYSEDATNAVWTKESATIAANQFVAPDGNTTMDKMSAVAATAAHRMSHSPLTALVQPVVASCFGKAAGWGWIIIQITGAGVANEYIFFNVSTGAVGSAPLGGSGYITNFGNGNFRCELATVSNSTSAITLYIYTTNANGTLSPLGNGADGAGVWGQMLEFGRTRASSYIPTSAVAVDRNADVATVTLPAMSDILVQDSNGGAWITGVSAGSYNLTPRTGQRHITRWRAFPAGAAANHPELAVASTSSPVATYNNGVQMLPSGELFTQVVGTGSATSFGQFNGQFGLTAAGSVLMRVDQAPGSNRVAGLPIDPDGTLHVTASTSSAVNTTGVFRTDSNGRVLVQL